MKLTAFMNDIEKPEAVAYVAAVLRSAPALASSSFQTAMDLSRKFDINGQDLLEYRREQARRT